jgi:chitinase
VLPYRVIDAEFSLALNAIILVTDAPDRALHIYDPETDGDQRVPLPLTPSAVSVTPDGLHAAVGYDAHASFVDLSTATLTKTCDVTSDTIDVVAAGNGWAYVFPRTDQWSAIHGVRQSDCMEALSGTSAIYAGTVAKLHPDGTKMYGANRGLSPSDIERYGITGGAPVYSYDSPYHGDYPMCGDLWPSQDGARLFTACGRVFRSSDVRASDMTYNGTLEGTTSIRFLTHSAAIGKVFVVPYVATTFPSMPDADLKIRVHNYEFLTFDREIALPSFPGPVPTVFKAHGRFVFARSNGARVYSIVQADASSGALNDFAIVAQTF